MPTKIIPKKREKDVRASKKVISLYKQGLTNKEIAKKLGKTEVNVAQILFKNGLSNRNSYLDKRKADIAKAHATISKELRINNKTLNLLDEALERTITLKEIVYENKGAIDYEHEQVNFIANTLEQADTLKDVLTQGEKKDLVEKIRKLADGYYTPAEIRARHRIIIDSVNAMQPIYNQLERLYEFLVKQDTVQGYIVIFMDIIGKLSPESREEAAKRIMAVQQAVTTAGVLRTMPSELETIIKQSDEIYKQDQSVAVTQPDADPSKKNGTV